MRLFLLFFVLINCSFTLSAQVVYSNTESKIDSILKVLKHQDGEEKLKSYEQLASHYIANKPEIAIKYIDTLKNQSELFENSIYATRAEIMRAFYFMEKANYKKAEELYLKNIVKLDSLGLEDELTKAYSMLGITQMRLGNLDDALASQLKALKKAENLNYTESKMAGFYMNVGIIYIQLDKPDITIEYFSKAEQAFSKAKNQPGLMRVKANIAQLYLTKKDYQKAISIYKETADFFESINDTYAMGRVYNRIGEAYKLAKDFINAKIWYNKALILAQETDRPNIISLVYRDLGRIAGLEKNNNEALSFYKKSLETNLASNNKKRQLDDYSLISRYYERNNDYKNAFEYLEKYQIIKDSIFNKESQDKINELNIKFQTERKEAALNLQKEEIKTLNAQAKNDKLTKTLYGIGMFSFIAIAGLLYFGFKQRIKKNKIEHEKQEEIYKQEIEYKKKELASQTLHLVQKSSFIQELKENLEKIKQSPELFKVEFRRLVMLLKRQNAEDKDWEVFKSYFSEVHNDFDQKIKTLSSDVTEKEIRLASFLRMKLSTKEIASMLNVLPDSVIKSKYRLKKKLALAKEDDLTQFLNTL